MSDLIALDLDRTLIYSADAAAAHGVDVTGEGIAACVETLNGRPISYLGNRARDLLIQLAASATVAPATTRSVEQFRRIRLPGLGRFAVCTNGAEILVDGVRDARWRAEVDRRASVAAPVDEVVRRIDLDADPRWMRSRRVADGAFCYVVVDPAVFPDDLLSRWRTWSDERGWNVTRQGRKIYLVPDAVSKSAAVAEVRRRLPETGRDPGRRRMFAAGDGVLDRSMLVAADRAVRPRHGELEELGWCHRSLAVTTASGLDAAAEILETIIAWLRDDEVSAPLT